MNKNISVIGSGRWGTALAQVIAGNGFFTTLLGRNKKVIDNINCKNISPHFDQKLSHNINASFIKEDILKSSKYVFIVVSSDNLIEIIHKINSSNSDAILVICSKGIDVSGSLFSDMIEKILPNDYCFLSGPNFADEVFFQAPCITTLASKKKFIAEKICKIIQSSYFSVEISNDVMSCQLYSAIKNILAIGCGIIDGLNLGENAKAKLILKGINETNILIQKIGGNNSNFFCSYGLGDLFLTCSSRKSRNYSLGMILAKGENKNNINYEGERAIKGIINLAKKLDINIPIYSLLYEIIDNKISNSLINKLKNYDFNN